MTLCIQSLKKNQIETEKVMKKYIGQNLKQKKHESNIWLQKFQKNKIFETAT